MLHLGWVSTVAKLIDKSKCEVTHLIANITLLYNTFPDSSICLIGAVVGQLSHGPFHHFSAPVIATVVVTDLFLLENFTSFLTIAVSVETVFQSSVYCNWCLMSICRLACVMEQVDHKFSQSSQKVCRKKPINKETMLSTRQKQL